MLKTGVPTILLFFLILSQLVASDNSYEGYEYIFPSNNSKFIHPNSTIIIRFKNLSPKKLINLSSVIKLNGSRSGNHTGTTVIASDKHTIIFKSKKGFAINEEVSVKIDPKFSQLDINLPKSLTYKFTILAEEIQKHSSEILTSKNSAEFRISKTNTQPMIMPNGVSVPSDFPHVNITNYDNPSSDYIFLNNWGPPNYNIIFDTSGDPVWYWRTSDKRRDFKVQSNGWITMLVRDGYGGSGEGYIALTENFEFIKSMCTTNGYTTDEHELFMLPNNGYFLIGRRETIVDMSQYVSSGKTNAIVRETCIQEFTAEDEMIFIWRAWDHFDIQDLELELLTGSYIRFPHMNAIFTDEDGHILLSSRHLSEISKINRNTGEFIWRLVGIPGSVNNDFQFINDPLSGFRNQHAIRSTGNLRYTLFDNGNMHYSPQSRGVEYEIDTINMTAKLIWEYKIEQANNYSYYMGNVQRLPNENTHINWAVGDVFPIAQEITPEGNKLFEMKFNNGYHVYRSFRHPWKGNVNTPYLILEPQIDNLTLIFNKFGDKNIEYYNIYGGRIPNPTTLLDSSHTTLKQLVGLQNGARYYFRVTAVDNNGQESAFSNEEDIIVNIIQPGSNLIVNGDFENELNSWIWGVGGTASADVQVNDGICNFMIENGGSQIYDVQLRQNNIPLIQGQNYTFEFDAWADETRIVEIKVGQDVSPYTNYSLIGYTALSPAQKRYVYTFEMKESSDNSARVVINSGMYTPNIFIDNLSLKMDAPTKLDEETQAIYDYSLSTNYPNPFNPSTTIIFSISQSGHVSLKVFDILGSEIAELVDENKSAGTYSVKFDALNLSSGIYFYSLNASGFSKVRKMLLLK